MDTSGYQSILSPRSPSSGGGTPLSPRANASAGGNGREQSSLEVVKALTLLEQKVIKFVKNAQRTTEVMATLPAETEEEDAADELEDLVNRQLEILNVSGPVGWQSWWI